MNFTTNNTLAEIANSDFRAARIFENYNLDFCCKGNRSLEEACNEKKINANNVIKELNAELENIPQEKSFDKWKLDELTRYIIDTHHVYTKKMLPVIFSHLQKVSDVHGKNHPEVIRIADIFSQIQSELLMHMMKEEKMLFPFIIILAESENSGAGIMLPPFGSITGPISVMESEHEEAGNGFYKIRELSNNYSIPEDACSTYKVLYQELEEFEKDLHKHIHMENNILFPKAIELEKSLMG